MFHYDIFQKAELRKHVFDAIFEQERAQEKASPTGKISQLTDKMMQDHVSIDLIREYLTFHQLDYTLNMFLSESGLNKASLPQSLSRKQLADKLNISTVAQRPLLSEYFRTHTQIYDTIDQQSPIKQASPIPVSTSAQPLTL